MSMPRRCTLGVLLLAILFAAAPAGAQVLRQVPAKAFVVIKVNNIQGVSDKLGAFAQKLGVAMFEPAFGDPLGAIKKEFNIKDGLDAKGEAAVAFYEPGDDDPDPRILILLPVSDYKAFLANLQNVKQDGDLTTFTMPDDDDPIFVVNWGSYAAMTPYKELVAQAPAGIEVAGLSSRQLASNDLTVFADLKVLGPQALPMLQMAKTEAAEGLDAELKEAPGVLPKFAPAIKAMVMQVINIAERTMTDGQAATFGLTLVPEGINLTVGADFAPTSYIGQMLAKSKNTEDSLLAGIPEGKYIFYGGLACDPAVMTQMVDDFLAPVSKELAAIGDEARPVQAMIEAMKASTSAMESSSFAQAMVAGGAMGMMPQQVQITRGDAQKFATAQKRFLELMPELTKLLPPETQLSINVNTQAAAKKIADVDLDQVTMVMKATGDDPDIAQFNQMMQMMFGAEGMTSYMGIVDPKTHIVISGADDATMARMVEAARKGDDPLAQNAGVKAVSAQLPKSRAMVMYVGVDNIIAMSLQMMAQQGMQMNLRPPQDLAPLGMSISTEGPAFRADVHIPSSLIEQLVAFGMQAAMGFGAQGGPPGGL